MPMNRVQLQPGPSMLEFLSLCGTEEFREAALIGTRRVLQDAVGAEGQRQSRDGRGAQAGLVDLRPAEQGPAVPGLG